MNVQLKQGDVVLFGTHQERDQIRTAPAIVGLIRDDEIQENGYPTLDLFILHPYRQQNGWAAHVKGFDKLRVGGWCLVNETDTEFLGQALVPDTKGPEHSLPKPVPPPEPPKELDPQTDGMPNIFGGITRYNPANNRQQHTNDKGEKLYICPTCHKDTWWPEGAKPPQDNSCCAVSIARRHPGEQASTGWDKWKIPGDDVLVGTKIEGEPEDDRPVIGD